MIVNLSKGGTETPVKNFMPDSSCNLIILTTTILDKYIAYVNEMLYVANKE